jgi:hypothetical protein
VSICISVEVPREYVLFLTEGIVQSARVTKPKTAEELLPLVAELAPQERVRLLNLIAASSGTAAVAAFGAPAPRADALTVDDLLSWDSEGWELA